jgi:hypothetical protein
VNEAQSVPYAPKQENAANSMDISKMKKKIHTLEKELTHRPTFDDVDTTINERTEHQSALLNERLDKLSMTAITTDQKLSEVTTQARQAVNITWLNGMVANMNNSMITNHCDSDGEKPLETLSELAINTSTYIKIAEQFRNMIGKAASRDQGHSGGRNYGATQSEKLV